MDIIQHFINNLEKLNGANWVTLIQAKEEFAHKCDWSKLSGRDWVKLVKMHPQFKDRIPFDQLEGWDWGRLLPDFPEFADQCSPDKRNDWCDFIEAHPDHPVLKDFDFSTLEEWDWDFLLAKHPFLLERYPSWNEVSENDLTLPGWALRVAAFPEKFADCCPWEKLDGENWVQILSFQPQFADKCDWSKLMPSQQAKLLIAQPQFADKCSFQNFTGSDWASLLSERPEFADQCQWEKLDGWDWKILLEWQEQFAGLCCWEKLDTQAWSQLLDIYPQFADKYNCPWDKFTSWNWAELINHRPQFADKCDLSQLDSNELYLIFSNQPTLIREDLIPQLGKRLIDFLCEYPEYTADYAGDIKPESAVQKIKEVFDDFHIRAEVQVMSMFAPEEAYIAKVVCVDCEPVKYRGIVFRNGGNIVQADADGKNITEALVRLYSLVMHCWRNDFSLDFDPPPHNL